VFGSSAITLAVVALLASWIPARAATRVDPLTTVRADN
jgi:ABC-type lipoprotein release transport system permease subunit